MGRGSHIKSGLEVIPFTIPHYIPHYLRRPEVLDHLVRGRTIKQIAHRLGVTDHTVKTQVTRSYEKFEVRNRVDLYALAVERGWVKGSVRR